MLVTKKVSIIMLALFLLAGSIILLSSSSIAQKVNEEKKDTFAKIDEQLLKSKPVETVTNFWRYSQEGNLDSATSLRTREYKGITIGIKKDRFYREWEELIYESEMSLVSVEQVEIIADDKWEVAIKVKKKEGKQFYLFHTVVRKNNEWKILRITY